MTVRQGVVDILCSERGHCHRCSIGYTDAVFHLLEPIRREADLFP
jgi:hypothetical protein